MSLDVWLTQFEETVFEANITHNLSVMANAGEFYKPVWRPDELGIIYAFELIVPLTRAIYKLKRNCEEYKKLDSDNGWGTYDDFVPWLEKYLEACVKYPSSLVHVDR